MKERLILAIALLAATVSLLSAQTTGATNAAPAVPAAPTDIIQTGLLVPKSETVLTTTYPAPDPTKPDAVTTQVRQEMADNHEEFQRFAAQTTLLLAQSPSLETIRSFEKRGNELATIPAGWNSLLTARATELDKQLTQIAKDLQSWTDTQTALKSATPPAPDDRQRRVSDVIARLKAVQDDDANRQNALSDLENTVSKEAKIVTSALGKLSTARDHAITELFLQNAPPVWSTDMMPAADPTSSLTLSKQWTTLINYAKTDGQKFVLHGLLALLLVGLFFWLRGFARTLSSEEPGIARAAHIFEMPISAGLLLSIFAGSSLYYPVAPRLLFAIFGAVALIPSVSLLRHLIERRMFPVLYALVAFYFLEEIRSVAALGPAAERAYLLAEVLGAVVFLSWLLRGLRRDDSGPSVGRLTHWAGWIAFLALAAGWLTDVLGYTLLANLIWTTVQRSATSGLALYAAIRVIEALLFIGLRLRPLSTLGMVRLHRPVVLLHCQHALTGTALLAWISLTLEMLPWNPPLGERLFGSAVTKSHGWLGYYSTAGDYAPTLAGKLIVAVLVVWLAFQVSRLSRFVLETEFYPRLRLGAGVPYAISTSLHYVVLVLAFIGATYALGIDMTKFTILVSALGVGVGFGLQNIINNFVSGLILLFERPVKIGDSVQNVDAIGVVERIGIRASVLRSASGSEVIVPNASLISNNVTNWTLSSSERIILIPLNLPRGPESAKVIELLVATAKTHPKVLPRPEPQVLAQTLGANLGLELRVWTRASEDWTRVRSDIVLAINDALTKESIALA